MSRYARSLEELEQAASMFWLREIYERAIANSVIPRLLETQNQLISILGVQVEMVEDLFQIIEASTLSANLFLKHLVVLSDFGGENLKRLNSQFHHIFESGVMTYSWLGEQQEYRFRALPVRGRLSDEKLGISVDKLDQPQSLTDLHRDIIAVLLFGNASDTRTAQKTNFLVRCEIGDYLGQLDKLSKYITQRYIWVSRITGGAISNAMGQIAEAYIVEYIQDKLDVPNLAVKSNGNLPGVTHNDGRTLTTFDLVISRGNKHVGIEISFQVTTNSVIERKAGQVASRFEQVVANGHKIAYIVDGAGNFDRRVAVSTICDYSHCTVAFSPSELGVLCDFLREVLYEE